MRHAEFFSDGAPARIEIDADDLVGAGHARALDDVEADTAEAEHCDVRAWPSRCGVDDGADAGRNAAADIADLVERRVLTDSCQCDLRQHSEVGKRRATHVVKHRIAVAAEAAGGGPHNAPSPRGGDWRSR